MSIKQETMRSAVQSNDKTRNRSRVHCVYMYKLYTHTDVGIHNIYTFTDVNPSALSPMSHSYPIILPVSSFFFLRSFSADVKESSLMLSISELQFALTHIYCHKNDAAKPALSNKFCANVPSYHILEKG